MILSTIRDEQGAMVKVFYDAVSGERAELLVGVDSRKNSCPYRAFVFVSQAGARYLSSLRMTSAENRLWAYLLSKIDWNNGLDWKASEAAKSLEWDLAFTGRTLRCLVNRGLCWRITEPGASQGYLRVHPQIAWKGSGEAVPYVSSTAPALHENADYWNKHYRKSCGFADRPDGWLLDE